MEFVKLTFPSAVELNLRKIRVQKRREIEKWCSLCNVPEIGD